MCQTCAAAKRLIPAWSDHRAAWKGKASPQGIHTLYREGFRRKAPRSAEAQAAAVKSFGQPVKWGSDPYSAAMEPMYKALLRWPERLASGKIDPADVEGIMVRIVAEAHRLAYLAGQEMAGGEPSETAADAAGFTASRLQVAYIRGFANALKDRDERYWDEEKEAWRLDAIRARSASYIGATRGTGGDGFLQGSPLGSLFDWDLGSVEEHCDECPVMAANGPYLGVEDFNQLDYPVLFIKPGSNDTPCLFNCSCRLREKASGSYGPGPFEFDQDSSLEEAA